jgi:molybdenum cofactor guanylyltransferase
MSTTLPLLCARGPNRRNQSLTTRHNPISIAVLAGGQSRRMGTDKALVTLTPGGPPLISIVIEHLRYMTDDIFIVSVPRPEYEPFGVPVVQDRYGDTGPLGAIATALSAARHDTCLIVSADMPFLNRELLLRMIEQPRTYDLLVPQLQGESRQGGSLVLQTLHALYAKSCLPAIGLALSQGELRTTSFHEAVRVEIVSETLVSAIDPNRRSFTSVNSPDALDSARELLRTGQVVL